MSVFHKDAKAQRKAQNNPQEKSLRACALVAKVAYLLRRTVNSAHRSLHSPFSLREKDTPPGMEAVDRAGNRRSRMRASLPWFALTPALSTHAPGFALDRQLPARSTSPIPGLAPPASMQSSRGEREKSGAHYLTVGSVIPETIT